MGTSIVATIFGGLFPAQTIAAAREWSRELNEQVEGGIDPRAARRAKEARESMTIAKARAVAETDLIDLVEAKGKAAKIRANRLAAELKLHFHPGDYSRYD